MPVPANSEGQPAMVDFAPGKDYCNYKLIGAGAFGLVVSAIHKPSGTMVAIKKIRLFDHGIFCLRTLREIKILKHFDHENIISILDIFQPESLNKFKAVYLAQEYMETDLSHVIKSQQLSDDHTKYFTYQLLRGLKAIHSANIVHRDLKPANILLDKECNLKICDFGFARTLAPQNNHPEVLTEYVCTRWYRAPEVMITFGEYGKGVDIWSVSCILSEMLSGKPLFPAKGYHEQILLILDVLGSPTDQDLASIQSERARSYITSMPKKSKIPFRLIHPNAPLQAVDLVELLLTFNPNTRISAEMALNHPYLADYHDEDDEPDQPVLEALPGDFDVEGRRDQLSKEQLKRLIYAEVMA